MKLTTKMQYALDALEKGHKGWFAWTDKQVKCNIYFDADNENVVLSDHDCLCHTDIRKNCVEIHSSTVKALLKLELIVAESVVHVSDRFGPQTFDYYKLAKTVDPRCEECNCPVISRCVISWPVCTGLPA